MTLFCVTSLVVGMIIFSFFLIGKAIEHYERKQKEERHPRILG